MKAVLFTIFFIFGFSAFADELKVELNPARPVVGEPFQAFFRIFTSSESEPAISFNPSNIEVVGKTNQGISTRTVYANGKLTVTREITIVYDLVASKPGFAQLGNIFVQLDGKTIRHPTLSLNVLKEREELPDVFVKADIPKSELYLGEGIVVRYYIYSKVQITNVDVKKYPKLNNFLKRFLQEPERTDRVSVDGQIYNRIYIYGAKLYPEKTGELSIDALQLSATYPDIRPGDPFSAFGLGRDFKTRTMGSETTKIKVKPLPEPIPPHFTGLVGKHDFQLQFGQTRLIVNEPLEVKLTVTGPGALENFEAPVIIKNDALEEFESNGDLKITDADNATKIFDYTFLARENLTLPSRDLVLSYFDPDTQKYLSTKLNIPQITIAGGVASAPKTESSENKKEGPAPEIKTKIEDFAPPVVAHFSAWRKWVPTINIGLAALALLISLGWLIKTKKLLHFEKSGQIPVALRKGNFELSEFLKWMTPLIKQTGKSPLSIIKDSPLSVESKRYFIDLLAANDYKDYSLRKSNMEYKYRPTAFKELGRYIESVKDEDSSQST